MTPYEMGKYAALQDLGLTKEAQGFWAGLKTLLGFGGKAGARTAARGAARTTATTTAKRNAARTATRRAATTQNAATPRRTTRSAGGAAQKETDVGEAPGLLSQIPWWGKALGAGGLGYGAYRMMQPDNPEPQGMQPYFGPGTGYPPVY